MPRRAMKGQTDEKWLICMNREKMNESNLTMSILLFHFSRCWVRLDQVVTLYNLLISVSCMCVWPAQEGTNIIQVRKVFLIDLQQFIIHFFHYCLMERYKRLLWVVVVFFFSFLQEIVKQRFKMVEILKTLPIEHPSSGDSFHPMLLSGRGGVHRSCVLMGGREGGRKRGAPEGPAVPKDSGADRRLLENISYLSPSKLSWDGSSMDACHPAVWIASCLDWSGPISPEHRVSAFLLIKFF